MATKAAADSLATTIDNFASFNLKAGLKENLGDQSLAPQFSERIADLNQQLERAKGVALKVNDNSVKQLQKAVSDLLQNVDAISGTDPTAFMQQRSQFIANLTGILDRVDASLLPFRILAQEDLVRKLLEPDNATLQSTQDSLKQESEIILAEIRREADSILANAKKQATNIHSTARDTASGVSLINAQGQFDTLIATFRNGAIAAGLVAVVGFSAFFGYAVYLLHNPPEISTIPSAVFSVVIRVTVLGSIATVVGIALKIFRSNLHLLYHTLHRKQLTNSIQTFVDAARTDEQRDTIFAKLVEAVSSFGNSGLIDGSDDVPNTSKLIVEAIPKILSGVGGKS